MKFRANHLLLLSLTLILLIAVPSAASPPITGKVAQVKDGDTVAISPIEGGQFFICRLYGIDAPETPKNGKSVWTSPGLIDTIKGTIGSNRGGIYVEPEVHRGVQG